MNKKFKAATVKKVVEQQTKIKTDVNPHLLRVAEIEAGELYEGVTDNATVEDEAEYRMITKSDDTVSSQGS